MPIRGKIIKRCKMNTTAFKHGDTTADLGINLSDIYGSPVRAKSTHTFTAKVANESGFIHDYPCKIDGTGIVIDSKDFFELGPGDYQLEIWENWTNDDGSKSTAIYPSPKDTLGFTIYQNIEDETGKVIQTIDFRDTVRDVVKAFLKDHPGGGDVDLSDYYTKSDVEGLLKDFAKKESIPKVTLDIDQRLISINGQSITIPDAVDLSDYVKKGEVPQVTYDRDKRSLTVNGVAVDLPASVDLSRYYTKDEVDNKISAAATGGKVDLTGYLKVADADKKYATKEEIPDVSGLAKKTDLPDMSNVATKNELPQISIDTNSRTITINGTAITIPGDVDLSGYATKAEVPKVTYDAGTKALTINGTKVELPSNVDLSGYYTKSEVDDKLAQAVSGGKVDLTGYLTKTEASQTYATKAELPSVDGLAKESDLPKITLDVPNRTITLNGQTLAVPDTVDLSHFYTKDEVDTKLAQVATGGKVDLTGYLTKVDADATYMAKDFVTLDTDKRVLTLGGQTITIPDSVDLSGYLTKSDAESTYAKKGDIPSLDGYAKKEDVPQVKLDVSARTLTLGTAEIHIPDNVDLGGYATKAELPQVSIDTQSRTVTINGQSIKVPGDVDLSGYYTKAEVDTKVAAAQPDLTPYMKIENADKKYADKAALGSYLTQAAASSTYATKAEIPTVPDMTEYAKKSDIPSVEGFAKESELKGYATTASVAEADSKAAAAMDKAEEALSKASSGATIDYDKLYNGFEKKLLDLEV